MNADGRIETYEDLGLWLHLNTDHIMCNPADAERLRAGMNRAGIQTVRFHPSVICPPGSVYKIDARLLPYPTPPKEPDVPAPAAGRSRWARITDWVADLVDALLDPFLR